MNGKRLLTPEEVAAIFRKDGTPDRGYRWAVRHASGYGFLAFAARRVGRTLLFDARCIERLVGGLDDERS